MLRIFTCIFVIIVVAGCGDDGRATTPTRDAGRGSDAGSAPDSGATTGDSGTPSADSGTPGTDAGATVDAGPTGTGACRNPADDAVFAAADIEMVAGDCASGCFGGGQCTADCLVDGPGLTPACAQCWGDVTACTSGNCALQCLGGDSPQCESCRDANGCTAAFDTCSGL